MATHETLTSLFSAIADSIRGKTGDSAEIVADNFPTAIDGIAVNTPSRTDSVTGSGDNRIVVNAAATGVDLSVYNRATVMLLPFGALQFPADGSVVALVMRSPAKADITYADKTGALARSIEANISVTFGKTSVLISSPYIFLNGQVYEVVLWRD